MVRVLKYAALLFVLCTAGCTTRQDACVYDMNGTMIGRVTTTGKATRIVDFDEDNKIRQVTVQDPKYDWFLFDWISDFFRGFGSVAGESGVLVGTN